MKGRDVIFFNLLLLVNISVAALELRGSFQVRISRFWNPLLKQKDGSCCSEESTLLCQESCKTHLRVCVSPSSEGLSDRKSTSQASPSEFAFRGHKQLIQKLLRFQKTRSNFLPEKHYQKSQLSQEQSNDISKEDDQVVLGTDPSISRKQPEEPYSPCSLGHAVSKEIDGDDVDVQFDFPFEMPSPGSFKLVIEAWSEVSNASKESNLIARREDHHVLKGDSEWQAFEVDLEHEMGILYSVRVACSPPYFGSKCSMRCDNVGASKPNKINCTDTGEVTCVQGWRGALCDKAACRKGCHPTHGYCTQPGECKCALGWRGKNCDECVPLPGCKHGFCSTTSYECICEGGWEGSYCSIPICREGCQSTRGYCKFPGECRCRIGWEGETCDACKPLDGCTNGFCTKPLECRCRAGWTGILCDKPICRSNCSREHGTCSEPGGCRCEVGWWGENCDTCFPYPGCQRGTCEQPWECNCQDGWKGLTCSERVAINVSFCANHPTACKNGGTCADVRSTRNYICTCPPLFTGQHCSYLTNSRASLFPIISRGFAVSRYTFSTQSPLSPPIQTSSPTTTQVTTSIPSPTTTQVTTSPPSPTTTQITTSPPLTTLPTETTVASLPATMPFRAFSTSEGPLKVEEYSTKSYASTEQEEYSTKSYASTEQEEQIPFGTKLQEEGKIIIMNSDTQKIKSRNMAVNKLEQNEELRAISKDSEFVNKTQYQTNRNDKKQNNPSGLRTKMNGGISGSRKLMKSLLRSPPAPLRSPPAPLRSPPAPLRSPPAPLRSPPAPLRSPPAPSLILGSGPGPETIPPLLFLEVDGRKRTDYSLEDFGDQRPRDGGRRMSTFRPNPNRSPFYPFLVSEGFSEPSSLSARHYIIAANYEDFSPPASVYHYDTPLRPRINRRTTQAENLLSVLTGQSLRSIARPINRKPKTYYEENLAGRVHIGDVAGVDKHAPIDDIVNAFIELKKLPT